jgi:hypothetical protein
MHTYMVIHVLSSSTAAAAAAAAHLTEPLGGSQVVLRASTHTAADSRVIFQHQVPHMLLQPLLRCPHLHDAWDCTSLHCEW